MLREACCGRESHGTVMNGLGELHIPEYYIVLVLLSITIPWSHITGKQKHMIVRVSNVKHYIMSIVH